MKLSPAKEKQVLAKISSYIAEGISHCEGKHSRCEENGKYVRGEQWSAGDIARQAMRERPSIPFNSTFKVVHAIANRETVERLSPKVFGRSAADNGIANILDEGTRWQRQTALSEHYESQAFRSSTIGGYGCMHKYWNPVAQNGDGMIADEDVPIWEMIWPARARDTNLSDRRWHVRGKWMDIEVVEGRFADKNSKLKSKAKEWRTKAPTTFPDTSIPMGNTSSMTGWGWGSVRQGQWVNTATKEAFVVEAEWKEIETYYRAAIPTRFGDWVSFAVGDAPFMIPGQPDQYGTPTEIPITLEQYQQLPPEQQESLRLQVMSETEIARYESKKELEQVAEVYEKVFDQEFLDWAERSREVVKYAVAADQVVVDFGVRPWGFSYYFITGFPFESADGMDFYGVVDIVKGPQDYKNAFLSNALAMYMSSPKSPIIVDEDAAPNVQQIADKIASPAAMVTVPKGFTSMKDKKWMVLPAPQFPPMMNELLQIAENGVEQSLGLSSIDINAQGDLRRISGTVVSAARTASNVIVAGLFDALRKFRKEYGVCNLKFLTKMYQPKELIRIVGEEKMEDLPNGLPESWDDIVRLDVQIDEQPSSPSEQMEVMGFLTNTGLLNDWYNSGAITLEDALDFIPQIPESRKRKILKNKMIRDQFAALQQEHQKSQIMMDGLISMVQDAGGQGIIQQFQQMVQEMEMQQGQPGAPNSPSGQPPTQ